MTIVTAVFGGSEYEALFRAMAASVRRSCPGARLEVLRPARRPPNLRPALWAANALKLRLYAELVQTLEDDVVLIDCDTLVLGDLHAAFAAREFDLAYTTRPGPWPVNCGVVFVRPTQRSRRFLRAWAEESERLLGLGAGGRRLVVAGGGLTQTAFLRLLKRGRPALSTLALPCAIWNSVEQTWAEFSAETRVLHVKAGLRQLVLGDPRLSPDLARRLAPLGALWRCYADAPATRLAYYLAHAGVPRRAAQGPAAISRAYSRR